jgi:hypothetical protein
MALTQAQQIEEYIKCYDDKTRIYFIENYLTTYSGKDECNVPFKLFPKQKEFLINVTENTNNIVLKPRQSGFSTLTSAWIAANLIFCPENKNEMVVIVTNQLSMSQEDLAKIKAFIEMTPRWFFGDKFYHPDKEHLELINGREVNVNTRSLFTKETVKELKLFNGCEIKARSSGKNASRGISAATIIMFDESAFIVDGKDVAASVIRAAGTVKDKRIIMISTPNLHDELFYETYNSAEKGLNNYKITYLKWYYDPRFNEHLRWYKDITKTDEKGEEFTKRYWQEDEVIDSQGRVKYDPDRWIALEKNGWKATSPWYIGECNASNNDLEKIARELECSFLGSGHMAVDPEVTDFQRNRNVTEEYAIDPMYENLRIWKPPITEHRYILAVDASRGDAGDNSTIELLDVDAIDDNNENFVEQVAEFEGKCPGDVLGEIAFKYGTLYNNALIVVDCIGGWGESVILELQDLSYPNLYYEDVKGKDYLTQNKQQRLISNDDGRIAGFHAKSARVFMVEMFREALNKNYLRIRSIRVIAELETWVIKNGRADHSSGCHDDTLMALSMGMFVFNNRYLTMERQKEQDKAILSAFVSALKNKPINNNTNNSSEPQRIVKPQSKIFKISGNELNEDNKIFARWYHKLGKANQDQIRYNEIMNQ